MAPTIKLNQALPVEFRPADAGRVPILVLNPPARMPYPMAKADFLRRPGATVRNFTLLQLARRQQLKQHSFERKFAVYGQPPASTAEVKVEFKS